MIGHLVFVCSVVLCQVFSFLYLSYLHKLIIMKPPGGRGRAPDVRGLLRSAQAGGPGIVGHRLRHPWGSGGLCQGGALPGVVAAAGCVVEESSTEN